jgi:hypothetical protein
MTENVTRTCAHTHTHTHPKPVHEHEDVIVLWNHEVYTEREVMAKRPDITIKNKKEKPFILIDMAITADRNVMQKKKYNSL